jgi:hypothetical protein
MWGILFKSQVSVKPIWGVSIKMGFNWEVEVATFVGICPMQ